MHRRTDAKHKNWKKLAILIGSKPSMKCDDDPWRIRAKLQGNAMGQSRTRNCVGKCKLWLRLSLHQNWSLWVGWGTNVGFKKLRKMRIILRKRIEGRKITSFDLLYESRKKNRQNEIQWEALMSQKKAQSDSQSWLVWEQTWNKKYGGKEIQRRCFFEGSFPLERRSTEHILSGENIEYSIFIRSVSILAE